MREITAIEAANSLSALFDKILPKERIMGSLAGRIARVLQSKGNEPFDLISKYKAHVDSACIKINRCESERKMREILLNLSDGAMIALLIRYADVLESLKKAGDTVAIYNVPDGRESVAAVLLLVIDRTRIEGAAVYVH